MVRHMLLKAWDRISLGQLRKMYVVCLSDPDRVARTGREQAHLENDEDTESRRETHLGLSQTNCSQVDLGICEAKIFICEICMHIATMCMHNCCVRIFTTCQQDIKYVCTENAP